MVDLSWCADNPASEVYPWITVRPVPVDFGDAGGVGFTVPAGFKFNFSGPWIKHVFFNVADPKYRTACAVHDYALKEAGYTRVFAAGAFAYMLKRDGVGKWRRLIMVLGVIIWNWI